MNLYTNIEKIALASPNKTALRFKERDITYGHMDEMVNLIAKNLIRTGINEGQKVALWGWNSPEWLFIYYAIIKIGAIVVPVNPDFKSEEVTDILEHAEAGSIFLDYPLGEVYKKVKDATSVIQRAVVIGKGTIPGVSSYSEFMQTGDGHVPTADRDARDPVALYYTSGTTGKPKGVICHHGGEIWAVGAFRGNFNFTANDKVLIVLPMAFIYGSACFSATLFAGGIIVILDKFHPRSVLEIIEEYQVSILPGVPTMFTMMLNYKGDREDGVYDLSSLKYCISSGASLPWSIYEQFKERFGRRIFEFFGLLEGRPILGYELSKISDDFDPKPNSCGQPFPGVEVKILKIEGKKTYKDDIGEIIFRNPNLCLGYHKDPEATKKLIRDGWCYSDDIMKKDTDGFFYYLERKKNLIKRGGVYVNPGEVEEVIYQREGVTEVAVIGVPDLVFGEQLKAFVVPKSGVNLTAEDIRDYCKKRLADYKVPQYIEVSESLPKGPTGKILKRVLKEMEAERGLSPGSEDRRAIKIGPA